jgi:hypothetical protein
VDNPTCTVLDGGLREDGRYYTAIDCRDARNGEQIRDVIGSGAMADPSQIAAARQSGTCYYTVRFLVMGGSHVRPLADEQQRALTLRRQQVASPATTRDWVREQMQADRQYGEQAQRLFGLLGEARRAAATARDEAGKLALAGADDRAALAEAGALEERVKALEAAQANLKKPDVRQQASGGLASARRALDEEIGQEVFAQQAEARRQLAAATFKDADGTEISLAQLLAFVAVADEVARWASTSLGLGKH